MLEEKTQNGNDTKEDVEDFVSLFSAQFGWVTCCFCCCHQTSSVTTLLLLYGLELKERVLFNMVVVLLIIPVTMVLIGGEQAVLPLQLPSNLMSALLKCKLEKCLSNAAASSNCCLIYLVGCCHLVEELVYSLILILSLPLNGCEWCYHCCCSGDNHWIGGTIDVIPGRENASNISLEQLIDDINASADGYCFLRVLSLQDRTAFMIKLRPSRYTEIYKRKAILLGVWIEIMGSLNLSTNYSVFRRAYWGENAGRRVISEQLTKFVVLMWRFKSAKARTYKSSVVEELVLRFQHLFVTEQETCIMLSANHMEEFEPETPGYKRSLWQNVDYNLPNQWYGSG